MASHPLISVIVPAYNVAPYVGAAIKSALTQTYPNIEVVVVNDGSTDDTATVLAAYESQIVLVSQENRGVVGARNAGLRAASGTFVALLDADDIWLPHRMERLMEPFEAGANVEIVTSDSYLMEDFTPTEKRSYTDRNRRPFPGPEIDQIAEIARLNFIFIGVLFRRELIERCGIFAEGTRRGASYDGHAVGGRGASIEGAEDYELWTRFLLSGARVGFVDEPLGYYRVRSGSLSDAKKEQGRAHLAVLERHLPELWRQGARGNTRDVFLIASSLAARGQRQAAATFFWHALRAEVPQGSRLRQAISSVRRLVRPSATWIEQS